jgi:hypothetical protein
MVSRWWRASLGDARVWACINLGKDAYDVTPAKLRATISTARNVTQCVTGFQIQTLNLTHCFQVTDGAIDFAAKCCPGLQRFVISGTPAFQAGNITDKSLESLLLHCPSLQHITAQRCRITDTGIEILGQSEQAAKLLTLDLAGNLRVTDDGASHLGRFSALRSLSLCACRRITPNGLSHLVNARPLPPIEQLCLAGLIGVGDEAASAIVHAHARTLIHLDLSGRNGCSDATLLAIAHEAMAAAASADVTAPSEEDAGATRASSGGETASTPVETAGSSHTSAAAKEPLTSSGFPLRELILRNGIAFTDEGVLALLGAVGPQLTRIDLGKCPRLTEASALAVGQYCDTMVGCA